MSDNAKQKIALRYRLHGMGFHKALTAMDFAEGYHTGTRKDGVTPEFAHQVSIANYVLTLSGLMFPERAVTVAFLHDILEDYPVALFEISDNFGIDVENAVWAMSKEYKFRGDKYPLATVFNNIAWDATASIVKLADRINNHNSMVGVFTPEKMQEYISETEEFFFPMLKVARRKFPAQELAYENAKLVLESQVSLVKAILG